MNILVTGAAGFIGSHLVDALLARGHRVVGVDNLSLGTRAQLQDVLGQSGFTFIEGDVSTESFVESFDPRLPIDWVWHMAANSDIPAGVDDPQVDFKDTFLTTFRVLAWMRRNHVPRLAFASTSAVYGLRDEPIEEDSGPMLPISNYGAMKLASEGCISAAAEAWPEFSRRMRRAVRTLQVRRRPWAGMFAAAAVLLGIAAAWLAWNV